MEYLTSSAHPHFTPADIYKEMLMAEITISLMFVVFSLALLSLCIRYVGRAGAQSRTLGVITGHPHLASVESDMCRLPKGMNSDVVCAFPIITYTDMKAMNVGKGLLECVVCLNEFKDRDFVRLLPKCDHAFHPECIDMWLSDHDTCPVCGTTLVPEADEKTVKGSEMNISRTLDPRNNNVVIIIDEADGI